MASTSGSDPFHEADHFSASSPAQQIESPDPDEAGLEVDVDDEDGLESLAQSARSNRLRTARTIMIVIGLITVAFNGFTFASAKSLVNDAIQLELDSLRDQGLEVEDEAKEAAVAEAVWTTRVVSAGFAFTGLLFFVLAALIYRFPVAVTVSGLVLYLASWAVAVAIEPMMLFQGVVVKIIIIAFLAKAISAAVAYERDRVTGVI